MTCETGKPATLSEHSGAVQKHLEIMQGVVVRMADNSRSCKVWCVTLVAATLVLVARAREPRHSLIALAPIASFYVLDAYYLMLERGFRASYDRFVAKVHAGNAEAADLYVVRPHGSLVAGFLWSLHRSISVLPFYFMLAATVFLAWRWVL